MSKIRKISQIFAALVLAVGLSAFTLQPAQASNWVHFLQDLHIIHHGGHHGGHHGWHH